VCIPPNCTAAKKQALERLPELFERDDRQERAKAAAHERQLEDLYAHRLAG